MPHTPQQAPRYWSGTPIYAELGIRRRPRRHVPLQAAGRPGLPDGWRPRGLAFNEDKTRIVTLGEGFDFPGVTVRRYHGTLLIKPSKAAVRRIRERLRTEVRVPARVQRAGGHRPAQPHRAGLGRLLPSPRGLPEPRRGETRMSGSQGGRTQQCVRPTRPDRASARFALASVITAITSPRKGFVRAFRSSFPRGP